MRVRPEYAGRSVPSGRLLAISDLHVTHPENRVIVQNLRSDDDADWLIVAGDVSESLADFEWALDVLCRRFETVIWVPGNHDLWTVPGEDQMLRGERRYRRLVDICRRIGVLTPEDEYVTWKGHGGPLRIAPLFLLYDYSFGRNIARTKARSLALAYEAGIVCSDEFLLHPDPHSSRESWCRERVAFTATRLERCPRDMPIVLVNHFPLIADLTNVLRHPEFAQWCGTLRTSDWHRRFPTAAVVYGHLHIPRTTWHDGVRFEDVSLGYPHEWHRQRPHREILRQIAPSRAPSARHFTDSR